MKIKELIPKLHSKVIVISDYAIPEIGLKKDRFIVLNPNDLNVIGDRKLVSLDAENSLVILKIK